MTLFNLLYFLAGRLSVSEVTRFHLESTSRILWCHVVDSRQKTVESRPLWGESLSTCTCLMTAPCERTDSYVSVTIGNVHGHRCSMCRAHSSSFYLARRRSEFTGHIPRGCACLMEVFRFHCRVTHGQIVSVARPVSRGQLDGEVCLNDIKNRARHGHQIRSQSTVNLIATVGIRTHTILYRHCDAVVIMQVATHSNRSTLVNDPQRAMGRICAGKRRRRRFQRPLRSSEIQLLLAQYRSL